MTKHLEAVKGPDPQGRVATIEAVIETFRPMLQADRGDMELVEVDGKKVFVSMKGACVGCQLASVTLSRVQDKIVEALGDFVQVLPASQLKRKPPVMLSVDALAKE
ncbi:NifU family protein [Cohaesibacter sp. CAU 1516]|uniref:NifU family protein n=1 Tax=Cohaesibacter sp. CAU 1516 TaxID=2576038 RepID=UPI001AEE7367|nr:NifU family protein [Cohaesibacter sp. CAU 1516]